MSRKASDQKYCSAPDPSHTSDPQTEDDVKGIFFQTTWTIHNNSNFSTSTVTT